MEEIEEIKRQLYNKIKGRLTMTEIGDICYDLSIEFEDLSGEVRNDKLRNLIEHLADRKEVDKLLSWLKKNRKDFDLSDLGSPSSPSNEPATTKQVSTKSILGFSWSALLIGIFATLTLIFGFVLFGGDNGFFSNNPKTEPESTGVPIAQATIEPTSTNTKTHTPTQTQTVRPTATPSNTPPPTPTDTPTITASQTPTMVPTLTPLPPLNENEHFVLIANFEHLGGRERDVTRFIFEDLQQQLEFNLTDSGIRVGRIDEEILTRQQAREIGEKLGATFLVWGNYDEDEIIANLQLGSLSSMTNLVFTQEEAEQTLETTLILTDERRQSIARPIMINFGLLVSAENKMGPFVKAIGQWTLLPPSDVEIVGNNVGTGLHRAFNLMDSDPNQAKKELEASLALAPSSSPIYSALGMINSQIGDYQQSISDYNTAIRLNPDWRIPKDQLVLAYILENNLEKAYDLLSEQISNNPKDWYSYYYLGIAYLVDEKYNLAAKAFADSIEREPTFNWPYAFALSLELRQGNLVGAQVLADLILKKFPDPTLGNRAMEFAVGNSFFIGPLISATSNIVLGQFEKALQDVDKALLINPKIADLYLLKGFAYCNLEKFEAADAAYSEGITIDPEFSLLYLLRAEAKFRQGDFTAAMADVETVKQGKDAELFADQIEQAESGLPPNCQTFLN